MDKNIYRTAAVVARLRGDAQTHDMLIRGMLRMDPLNHFAAFEKYYSGKEEDAKKVLVSRVTGEFRYETYIELALWYLNAGLLNESVSVMELCPETPVADYLSSYLAFKQNDSRKSQMYLERALKADDKLVFPYREEYAEILAWADKQQPSWKTKYYSALLHWNKRQFDAAKKLFNECGDESRSYSFYLARGRFLKRKEKFPESLTISKP
jgi:tetratricopeptide (TPR) repeat protein